MTAVNALTDSAPCLHQLFARQAATTPEAIALTSAHGALNGALHGPLTYGALDRRSNQLANLLRRRGVGPETLVAVCLERSPELVVALLAVLKSGGAYVPLDPSHPASRLSDILADCRPGVLITQADLAVGLVDLIAGRNDSIAGRNDSIAGPHDRIAGPNHPIAGRNDSIAGLADPIAGPPGTGAGLADRPGHVVLLDADRAAIEAESSACPASGVGPENLAYVLYTSGSTGRPKGVMVEHRHVVNTLTANQSNFGFSRTDTMPVIASFAFDIVLFELFGPLLAGGTAHLVTREEVLNLPAFLEQLKRCTMLHTLPSLMFEVVHEIVRRGAQDAYRGMRRVFVGGDAVPAELLTAMRQAFPNARLTVLYGPTESAIVCAAYDVPDAAAPIGQPLGRALANVTLSLCDANGRPVAMPMTTPDMPTPMRDIGEIFVGGASVSRGYLNRPELTAQRYPTINGARFYRTGDMARCLADGTLQFAGRGDGQVKIRGFRIELGDVEAGLLRHPAVHQAAVIDRDDARQGRHLVAYWVSCAAGGNAAPAGAASFATPTTHDLRAFLAAQVPDYMVPAYFVQLPALPLTPNGKVDRQALPPPNTIVVPARQPTAPRDGEEAKIAAIWAVVLGHHDFGAADAFLDAGGNSLMAMQVLMRLNETFGIDLPVRALFDAPTLAGQAAAVRSAQARARVEQESAKGRAPSENVRNRLPARATTDRADRAASVISDSMGSPLSAAQERLWFLDQLEPGSPLHNITLAQRLRGVIDPAVLATALDALIQRHAALRTRFAWNGDGPVQIIDPAGSARLAIIDLGASMISSRAIDSAHETESMHQIVSVNESEANRWAAWDAGQPFDLARGPLLRATLLRLADDDHVFVLTVHHIVFDGWSAGVFYDELAALYEAGRTDRKGGSDRSSQADRLNQTDELDRTDRSDRSDRTDATANLEPLEAEYGDVVRWEQAWLAGTKADAQRAYWRQRLAGVGNLELPTDRPRPAVQSFRGGAEDFELDAATFAGVQALGRGVGATPFMVLFAAYLVQLHMLTGQTDLVVGTPFAERSHPATRQIIGMLVNSLALRASVHGRESFRALLATVRETCLEAYEHHNLPFDRVVEAVNPPRDRGRNPIFQVFFALQNAPAATRQLSGVTIEPVAVPIHASPFDLALNLEPEGNGLRGRLHFATDLFDASTARQMADQFGLILDSLVRHPDVPIAELTLDGMAHKSFDQPDREAYAATPQPDFAPTVAPAVVPTLAPAATPAVTPAATPIRGPAMAAPRNALERDLAAMWQELLDIEWVGVGETFFDLGGHSLLAARFLTQIQHQYGEEIPVAAFFQDPTIAAIAERLNGHGDGCTREDKHVQLEETAKPDKQPKGGKQAKRGNRGSPILVPLQPDGAQKPLFCVHPIGGHVLAYLPLARALGADQPFFGLQSPGLVDSGATFETVEEMAREYVAAIRTVQPAGPYHLAGWSLGGMVAFAIAQRLHAAGEVVERVLLIDSCAPGANLVGDSVMAEAMFLADYAAELARQRGHTLVLDAGELARMTPAERVEHFLTAAHAADAIPPEWGAVEQRRILQVCQANAQAMARYQPGTYAGTVTLLRAMDAPPLSTTPPPSPSTAPLPSPESAAPPPPSPDADAAPWPPLPADLGWSRLLARPLEVVDIPGDHGSCLEAPHVGALAAAIKTRLSSDGRS